MFHLPNEFYVDPDDMHYAQPNRAPVTGLEMLGITIGVFVVVLCLAGAAVYVLKGMGLAALLPGIVDHQPRERRLFGPRQRTWLERFDDWKYKTLLAAIAWFLVLFAAGVIA